MIRSLLLLLCTAAPSGLAKAQSIHALGQVQPEGVSMRGEAVVGYGFVSGSVRAIRWTPMAGSVDLGFLPGGTEAASRCVSVDGTVVAGYSNATGRPGGEPFRWTATSGMVGLGVMPGFTSGAAEGISGDGSVVTGTLYSAGGGTSTAFRWTAAGGYVDLGELPTHASTYAEAISADGTTAVGRSMKDGGPTRAVRWVAPSTTAIPLGVLEGGSGSYAFGVSEDGSVVVGQATVMGDAEARAFRWTEPGGMVALPILAGDYTAVAWGVSGDGSTVVGESISGFGQRAFIWRADIGTVSMRDFLQGHGIDMSGWVLTSALGVSRDGQAFVGHGKLDGVDTAWVASLPIACLADYNGTPDAGDILDFLDFIQDFSDCTNLPAPCGQFGDPDLNGDTNIDILDFLDFVDAFGQGC